MALSIGIVGLPNVGKSTLFNALVKSAQAQASNFPFTTIDPNVGIVQVPDERLTKITEIEYTQTTVPTSIKFIDIAGLIRGAHKGEGLGNKFLSHIREVDAICLVVRAFSDTDTVHVEGNIDPRRDIETILSELALSDLQVLDKIKSRLVDEAKSADDEGKKALALLNVVDKIESALNKNTAINSLELSKDEQKLIRQNLPLLSNKPILIAFNVSEEKAGEATEDLFDEYKLSDILPARTPVVVISAKIEAEIAVLSETDKQEYLETLGLKKPGLERLVEEAYRLLNLITFYTAGPNEARAWTIREGDNAYIAAGKIHTDFQKKFIRAEVVSYDDLIKYEGWQKAASAGKLRLEGRDYIVHDGDIIFFRHS